MWLLLSCSTTIVEKGNWYSRVFLKKRVYAQRFSSSRKQQQQTWLLFSRGDNKHWRSWNIKNDFGYHFVYLSLMVSKSSFLFRSCINAGCVNRHYLQMQLINYTVAITWESSAKFERLGKVLKTYFPVSLFKNSRDSNLYVWALYQDQTRRSIYTI